MVPGARRPAAAGSVPTDNFRSPIMRLQLTVRPTGTLAEARDEVHRFERLPLVIGRSSACDLVLRDESRFISSNHAVIALVDGVPCIRDTSANGVFVNGTEVPLGRGNEMPLHDRDVLGIGDYALTVALGSGSGDVTDDPFAALLDEGRPSTGGHAPAEASAPPFDPWRGEAPDWPPGAHAHEGSLDGALHDPFGPTPSAPSAPPSAPPFADASAGRAADLADDWPDWPPEPARAPAPAPRRNERAADTHDGIAHDAGPSSRPGAAPDERSGRGGTRGLDGARGEALLLRCVEGLMALLHSRSELKQTMRTDVTTLRGTGNNPLKFSRDGREALARLLEPSPRGEYLSAERAIGEAIDDLALHQLAMLDGMKAAVAALLGRFDPDDLTERLTSDHPIAATIPLARDAKLWQLFREHYRGIEGAARDDLDAVFGREFRRAYEARVRELGRAPEPW